MGNQANGRVVRDLPLQSRPSYLHVFHVLQEIVAICGVVFGVILSHQLFEYGESPGGGRAFHWRVGGGGPGQQPCEWKVGCLLGRCDGWRHVPVLLMLG